MGIIRDVVIRIIEDACSHPVSFEISFQRSGRRNSAHHVLQSAGYTWSHDLCSFAYIARLPVSLRCLNCQQNMERLSGPNKSVS